MDKDMHMLAEKYKNELLGYSLRHSDTASELRRKASENDIASYVSPVLFSDNMYSVSEDGADYNDMGYLLVKIFFSGRGTPVIGASVRVVKGEFSLEQISDSAGKTAVMTLPCPAASDGRNICGCYDVEVFIKGFCSQVYFRVPVFAGRVTILPVELHSVTVCDSRPV